MKNLAITATAGMLIAVSAAGADPEPVQQSVVESFAKHTVQQLSKAWPDILIRVGRDTAGGTEGQK